MPRRTKLLVLALDIGSSSTRSAIFDEDAKRLRGSGAVQEYAVTYGADGAAELDARMLYRAVRKCVQQTNDRRATTRIAAVSASAFWHGLLGLDRERKPITPIYMWADSRSKLDALALRERLDERAAHARTGCMLRAPFWPAKLVWLRRTQPALFRRVKFWVSPADWVLEKLFGGDGTSASMASATGLLDLNRRQWDEELCQACGVMVDTLENISAVAAVGGRRQRPRLQVFTAIGDGAASNVGCGADRAGMFAINIGTSGAVRAITNRGGRVPFGLFRYVLDEKREVIGGAISNAGNLRNWCVAELQLGNAHAIERALDRTRAADNPLNVLPQWVEERSPDWPDDNGGIIRGLRQSTTASDIFAAATCSVFYRLATILELLEKPFGRAKELVVSGGVLQSSAAVRLLSDCLGRDIRTSAEMESSLRGAAVYALRRLGADPPLLPLGALVRCRPQLARKHRARRAR
ncbi:MAG: gluconokinase [Chthoniobacterales bacterium]